MDTSGGIAAGLAGRYAVALYGLARDDKRVPEVAASLATLKAALAEGGDLRDLTTSPLLDRTSAGRGIAAASGALGLDRLTTDFLGVLAKNRRLNQLPQIIRAFERLAADERGETTAEVTSAHPLSDAQQDALRSKLKNRLRRDVALDLRVDPAILGGLVVKVGSRMIDSSLKTKLDTLGQQLKGQ